MWFLKFVFPVQRVLPLSIYIECNTEKVTNCVFIWNISIVQKCNLCMLVPEEVGKTKRNCEDFVWNKR